MNTPLVSVIVPVYKAEAYLHKCVDSLLAQTMTDFEVLLIDDGSSDRSGKICDEYAAKDSRIRVFHKENGGVASARQVGIENVRGEYTIHADPDDWVEPNMLEELYAKAKEDDADMVICDRYKNIKNKQFYCAQKIENLTSENCLYAMFEGSISNSLCFKLVRTSCFKGIINFEEGFNLGEDQLFSFRLFRRNLNISYLPQAFYHYVKGINMNSYTASKDFEKRIIYMHKLFNLYRKELEGTHLYDRINRSLMYKELYMYFHAEVLSSRDFYLKFKNYKGVIQNNKKASLYEKFILYFSCLGFYRNVKLIYNLLKKIRL